MFVDGDKVLEYIGVDTNNLGNVNTVNFGLISGFNLQNEMIVYGDSFRLSDSYIGTDIEPEPSFERVTLSSSGTIKYSSSNYDLISVDVSKEIGSNTFSAGHQLDYPWEWREFRDRPIQQQLSSDANFGFIRINDRHLGPLSYSQGVGPCERWYESTDTGVWDWSDVDSVVQAIFDSGAEPIITISAWSSGGETPTVPPGMTMNPNTLLPNPDSYAAFVADWVEHFQDVGLPVVYYEIFNEIQTYIGWNWWARNEIRVDNFLELYDAAYRSMHAANPDIIVSFDACTLKYVFPKILSEGIGLDSINYHKYDDWNKAPNDFSDQKMFDRAEEVYFLNEDSDTFTLDYCRDTWYEQRGEILPILGTESNFNAACNPTTERVQTMSGAIRTALVLRMCVIEETTTNIYYTFTSDAVWETQFWGSGNGYGMIDSNTRHSSTSYDDPWYPYYVHSLFGSNMDIGDELVEVTSPSEDIRCLAWKNGQNINVLIIHKNTDTKSIKLNGISGTLSVSWIDGTIPYENPSIQGKVVNSQDVLTLNGYTVMLVQGQD